MTPVNLFDRSLISYALGKRERPVGSGRRCLGAEETQQSASCDETSCYRADKQT